MYSKIKRSACWVKFPADDILKYCFLIIIIFFFQKTGFDRSCKLSPVVTICMKYQILFFPEDNLHEMSNSVFWVKKEKKMPPICPLLNKPREW